MLNPDLVLINGEMHEHIIAAWAAGVPLALLNSFVSIWRQPGLPPPHASGTSGRRMEGLPGRDLTAVACAADAKVAQGMVPLSSADRV